MPSSRESGERRYDAHSSAKLSELGICCSDSEMVIWMMGDELGEREGECVVGTSVDGCSVGKKVGEMVDGCNEGESVGPEEGWLVGASDGRREGIFVGLEDGS